METLGLRLYIQPKKNAKAHFIRQYPDGNIYIFCNRYLGEASGKIMTIEEAKVLMYEDWQFCPNCQAAIEMAIERAAVLLGLHPHETALYSERIRETSSSPAEE